VVIAAGRPCDSYLAWRASRNGKLVRHGMHQDAQKSSTTTWPFRDSSEKELPLRFLRLSSVEAGSMARPAAGSAERRTAAVSRRNA
jgi:hypothetical protein